MASASRPEDFAWALPPPVFSPLSLRSGSLFVYNMGNRGRRLPRCLISRALSLPPSLSSFEFAAPTRKLVPSLKEAPTRRRGRELFLLPFSLSLRSIPFLSYAATRDTSVARGMTRIDSSPREVSLAIATANIPPSSPRRLYNGPSSLCTYLCPFFFNLRLAPRSRISAPFFPFAKTALRSFFFFFFY